MTRKEKFTKRGSIVRIRLRNFMTYSDIELFPGPKLNIILGPNGTGKSAIVCSIIVGLGGDVSLTGRASNITALVQWNCDWCSTEIELYNDRGDNYVIHRKITITGRLDNKIEHKSEWRLNDQSCKQQEIKKLTTELSIEVGNLCQFLPQDKVAAFVGMNSCQLLTSTLKAIGDHQLVEDHARLVKMTDEIGDGERKLARLKEDCQHNEMNARRLEADVEKLREREQLVKQKGICEQKMHYTRYLEAKEKHHESKETLVALKAALKRAEDSCSPYQQSVQTNQTAEANYKSKVSDCDRKISQASSEMRDVKDAILNRDSDCVGEFAKFRSKQNQEEHRKQALNLKERELEGLETKLLDAPEVDYSGQLSELDGQIKKHREMMLRYNREKGEFEDKLRDLKSDTIEQERERRNILSIKERRISLLKNRRPETYTVMEWLAKNQDKFRGRVLPPMIIELDVKDIKYASVVEHAIQNNELYAFVCEYEEDLKLLTNTARNSLNSRINVLLRPDKTKEEFLSEAQRRSFPSDMNFKGYLNDLITAPDAIERYLYGNFHIHRIPVFGEISEINLNRLLQTQRRFFAMDRYYQISYSRYDNKQITVSEAIRDAQHLVHTLDRQALRQCDAELERLKNLSKEAAEQFELRTKQLEETNVIFDQYANQFRFLTRKQQERESILEIIKHCKQSIDKLNEEAVDIENERSQLQTSIKNINMSTIKDLERLTAIAAKYVLDKQNQMKYIILARLARYNYCKAKQKYEDAKKDQSRLTEEIRKQREVVKTKEIIVERVRKSAEKEVPGFQDCKLDKRTKRNFELFQEDTVDSLEDKLSELKARIQGIYQDKNLENEFRRQYQELQDKRQQIAYLERSLSEVQEERRELKNDWKPKLERVVGNISMNFQDFIRKLNCDGEVRLSFDTNRPEDLSQYGISIKVKYRDDEASDRSLSSSHLSGGERVVATMLYMLALQPMTSVPFRCLDEINQGMDQYNERKLFEFLDKTAHESSSQYILVSPKLLKNLPFSENMKIHLVFNGPGLKVRWNGLESDGSDDDNSDSSQDDDIQDENDQVENNHNEDIKQENIADDDETDVDTEIDEDTEIDSGSGSDIEVITLD